MRDVALTYVWDKFRLYAKEMYFKMNMQGKNPMDMTEAELSTFSFKLDEHASFIELSNDIAQFRSKLDECMNKYTPEKILYVLDILKVHSKNTFLVGGCVRDSYLDIAPKDWDIVTDISYNKLKEIFANCQFKETGTQFLVFNLVYDGMEIEISNFRKDSSKSDGRRPDSVEIGTIETDIARRDFTVNAIYWNQNKIIADYKSVDDLKSRTLRFIGNPESRLKEDYLRGWRFHRLIKQKNLNPDNNSLRAVRRYWNEIYKNSNPHRAMMELEKITLK